MSDPNKPSFWRDVVRGAFKGQFAAATGEQAAAQEMYKKMNPVSRTVAGNAANLGKGKWAMTWRTGALGAVALGAAKGTFDVGAYAAEKLGIMDPRMDPNTGKPAPRDIGNLMVGLSEIAGSAALAGVMAIGGAKNATRGL